MSANLRDKIRKIENKHVLEKTSISERLCSAIEIFAEIERHIGKRTIPDQNDVVYGLRVASELGGNSPTIRNMVCSLGQEYNLRQSYLGDHIEEVHLFDEEKEAGVVKIEPAYERAA